MVLSFHFQWNIHFEIFPYYWYLIYFWYITKVVKWFSNLIYTYMLHMCKEKKDWFSMWGSWPPLPSELPPLFLAAYKLKKFPTSVQNSSILFSILVQSYSYQMIYQFGKKKGGAEIRRKQIGFFWKNARSVSQPNKCRRLFPYILLGSILLFFFFFTGWFLKEWQEYKQTRTNR